MSYTKTPWKIGTPPPNGEQTIGSNNGIMVAVTTTGYGVSSADNARRIVACVNACAGMETEHLENQSMLGETLLDRFNLLKIEAGKLTKQRDELLSASKEVVARWDAPLWKDAEPTAAVIVRLRKVISDIEGYRQ